MRGDLLWPVVKTDIIGRFSVMIRVKAQASRKGDLMEKDER